MGTLDDYPARTGRDMVGFMTSHPSEPIRAAGGIVIGAGNNAGKIAIVRRRRYSGEVGLPKGKLKKNETDVEAATREVEEETGIRASPRDASYTTHYEVDGRPKIVTYFLMDAPEDAQPRPEDSEEIESVEWLTPQEAIATLTHSEDRKLLSRVFGIGVSR
jgi:8-oxo-dGTP diphosphatase